MTQSELQAAERRLDEIEGALERLERGTYGCCEACGTPIGGEALAGDPLARTCEACLVARRSMAGSGGPLGGREIPAGTAEGGD